MRQGWVLSLFLLAAVDTLAAENVADTPHNLSVTGPGPFRSQSEDRICIFCHTPHSSAPDAPLWNRQSVGYTNYQSTTMDASAGQPGGSSILCLSCHDGTIALGDMFGSNPNVTDLQGTFLTGRSNLGPDLSNDHPVGIIYDSSLLSSDPELVNPSSVDLPLHNSEIQCVSCHDAHNNTTPPFLQKPTLNGELCMSCHVFSGADWSWTDGSHAVSGATPGGADPWPERKAAWKGQDVSENACMNCHAPHNAATPARLVKDLEEATCYRCHDGSVATQNIQVELQNFYRHPVEQTPSLAHNAAREENPLTMALHAECEDCHNPHASSGNAAWPMISFNPSNPTGSNHTTAPFINGSLAGTSGIDANGAFKPEAEYEYEVCFKCHGVPGDNACDYRRCSTPRTYDMSRSDGVYNLREKLDPGNPALISYHPVAGNNPSNNSEVPSLRNDIPLNRTISHIYCSDCHGSSISPAAGGAGPSGPHGSSNEGMLALRYEFNPQSSFSSSADNLCFKCHDSGSLFSDESFPHEEHVLKEDTSCINCHDPHGSAVYPHLINFLLTSSFAGQAFEITGEGDFNEPTWIDDGQFRGTCYLNCHGEKHDGESY